MHIFLHIISISLVLSRYTKHLNFQNKLWYLLDNYLPINHKSGMAER